MARRTKEQAAETKAQILRAAENLFVEKGYEYVSLEEIAASAGVTRGAVHWHFGNKQGLLLAIRIEAQSPLQELADRLPDNPSSSPLELLANTISGIFADLHEDDRQRKLVRMMMHFDISVTAPDMASQAVQLELIDAITHIFSAAEKRNGLRAPWTPRSAALAFSATVNGLLEEWALERSELPLVPFGQELVRQLLGTFSETTKT